MNQNHLSAAEVAMFREGTLSSRSMEMGRHLLTCSECRTKLPAVTAQEFRSCVVGPEVAISHSSKSRSGLFDKFLRVSVAPSAAFAGFIILLLAGLYLVRVESGLTSSEPMIAKADTTSNQLEAESPESRSRANPPSVESPEPIAEELEKKDRGPKRPQGPKQITRGNGGNSARKVPALQTAETRGNENPCSGAAAINVESNTNAKEILLRWDSVKGASSYDIYISDLDENLIDHFESDSQTQYRSTVQLEPEKTYRWKLIITLRNGGRIVGPLQTLKPGAVQSRQLKQGAADKQRGRFAIRCVEAK